MTKPTEPNPATDPSHPIAPTGPDHPTEPSVPIAFGEPATLTPWTPTGRVRLTKYPLPVDHSSSADPTVPNGSSGTGGVRPTELPPPAALPPPAEPAGDAALTASGKSVGGGSTGLVPAPELSPEPETRLRDPGELIAAVPAMLGFVPWRSLVVAVLRADAGLVDAAAVEVVTRMDLDNPGRTATGMLIERVAGICARHRAVAALALIVDDRATLPSGRHRGVRARKHRNLVAALEHRLDADGVPLGGAWAMRAIGAELPWWTVAGPARCGLQPDPAASLVTLRQVLEGRPLRGSREELVAAVEVDPVLLEQTERAMALAAVAAARQSGSPARGHDPEARLRAELERVLRAVEVAAVGTRLAPEELAEVAVALRDSALRDIMFGLAPGAHAHGAEALWLQLTRALPDPDRAEAAALLGYCAYVRGDGPLAGVALEAALNSDPDHRMATLLDIGLQTGMRPERLRRLADSGREAAAGLGFALGAEQPR